MATKDIACEVWRETRHWIECNGSGPCPHTCSLTEDDIYLRAEAARRFKNMGWHHVPGTGWLCPECAEKRKEKS